MNKFNAQELRAMLDYDAATGTFTRRAASGVRWAGSKAGSVTKSGYMLINLRGRHFMAHRLAWLYVYGEWPNGDIDHIDGDRLNNRIANLRDVSRRVNLENQRRPKACNKSGFLGVKTFRDQRFQARIQVRGVQLHLGTFDTPHEAHAAYVAAKRNLHQGCTL